jgi:Cof subfamily protein (haloacid dehalogenase superfamily)
MRWSAIYFDLDGTLLGPDGTVPPSLRAAAARARARGVRIGIATGRRATTTQPFAADIGVDAPCVLFNGARVVDAAFTTTLYATTLPLLPTRDVIARALALGFHVAAYVGERMLVDQRHPAPTVEAGPLRFVPRETTDLSALHEPATKLLFVDEPERLAVLRGVLVDEQLLPPRAHLVRSNPRFLELLPDGASKGTALLLCAATLGVDVDTIIAVGDDENDRDMLQAAGVGIAMGHAPASVQAVADHIVGADGAVHGDDGGAALAALLHDVLASPAPPRRQRRAAAPGNVG